MSKLVADSVLDFTVQSGYNVTKYYPDPTERRSKLIEQNIKMIGSELNELLQSVMSFEEAKSTMTELVNTRFNDMAHADAATLTSINQFVVDKFPELNVIFEDSFLSIHQNNMDKKWEDGKFHLREEDGKVLKPPNHQEPKLIINKLYLEDDFSPLTKEQVVKFVTHIIGSLYGIFGGNVQFRNLFDTDIHDCKMNPNDPQEVLTNQVDALIDILYYNTNTMVKLGIVY